MVDSLGEVEGRLSSGGQVNKVVVACSQTTVPVFSIQMWWVKYTMLFPERERGKGKLEVISDMNLDRSCFLVHFIQNMVEEGRVRLWSWHNRKENTSKISHVLFLPFPHPNRTKCRYKQKVHSLSSRKDHGQTTADLEEMVSLAWSWRLPLGYR